MTKLLEKDTVFSFNKECIEALELLKGKLKNAPIMVSPDWSQPFELMCDASDFAVRAFDIEIKNKKGAKNVAADHLSRLKNPHLEKLRDDDIDDNFPDKNLMNVSLTEEDKIPWFADFANYLVGKILRKGLTYAQRCKRCVYEAETRKILDEYHHGPTGGYYGPSTTAKKVFDAGFYWPTIFKEAHTLVQNNDACQRSEAEALPTNDARVVIHFLKKLFSRFGIPKALISDREVPPKTTQALLQRQRERKAKSILLLAIPDEYQLRFHGIKDAKTLWAAIKSRFGAVSNVDVNQKFLRALPSSWNDVALIMRNKAGIDDLDIDDLYNNLKVFEADIKVPLDHLQTLRMWPFFLQKTLAISSGPQLDNKDLEQIDHDDLEEIYLKWQVA
ncbi:reverse transcriptase domain-containing protein, partial [Tanacetum coccineum]